MEWNVLGCPSDVLGCPRMSSEVRMAEEPPGPDPKKAAVFLKKAAVFLKKDMVFS